MAQAAHMLSSLYEVDETAWLEEMSRLVSQGRLDELDTQHLAQYLTDMARRDKREVRSRLIVLMTHLLKWEYQPDRRSPSWRETIRDQRRELEGLIEAGSLRRHALQILEDAYARAVKDAADETGLSPDRFPTMCPMSLQEILDKTVKA